MKLTVKQLKALISESVAASLKESATIMDVMALTDKAHASLTNLKNAIEVVATSRKHNGESDGDYWSSVAEQVGKLASDLDSIPMLSKHVQSDEINPETNTNKIKRIRRSR